MWLKLKYFSFYTLYRSSVSLLYHVQKKLFRYLFISDSLGVFFVHEEALFIKKKTHPQTIGTSITILLGKPLALLRMSLF